VLCVGLVCLDIVAECQSYPVEDTDRRISDLRYTRGGNASNSSSVLAQLGLASEFLGNLCQDAQQLHVLRQDFSDHGVIIDQCPLLSGYAAATSLIISNRCSGSRTILHHAGDLPELHCRHLRRLDLRHYTWIHFEGRSGNIENIIEMMDVVRRGSTTLTISVEMEKPRAVLSDLVQLGDVVFISKEFAQFSGLHCKEEAVQHFMALATPGAVVVCAWGSEGAAAGHHGQLFSQKAFPPEDIVDTLGAGDTFNAAFIHARINAMDLRQSLRWACYVAGRKVGQRGFRGIATFKSDYDSCNH